MKINSLSTKQEARPQKHEIINMQCKALHLLTTGLVEGNIKYEVQNLISGNNHVMPTNRKRCGRQQIMLQFASDAI